ncbi:hypothetical protein llap_6945 [Limosa lapponica baueri]|uniref:Uncharacterized protein n=1 Tax=Limosa lapponica baueri TaxID=1758121 RepID=A0A2I0U9L2_LIMLA|nr:hypothetical protein llap_6945 [Limosa lapponica baueri]
MKLLLEFPTSALLSSSQLTRRLMAVCLSEEERCFIVLRLRTVLGGPKQPDFRHSPWNEDGFPHMRVGLVALSPVSGQKLWVTLVFPNNDPAAFMVAFYGCLLAEVVPVPIEVPLTRKYKTCKDGSVLGVTVTRIALLTHCQALTQACGYTEAETIVNVLDFKKDVGLWHGILTSVMNMMHVISIPYSLMKVNPLSWIQKVCQYKAKVACVKSRDMHWALVAHRDQRDINLSSLRMLIVADGANPWSISSCDAFLNVFQSKGLRQEVICPCASSPEALTVAIRRPTDDSNQPPGRGVLSMHGLTYGVIRVDSEEKLSVLTVQDVGLVMPGAIMCSVKPDGIPQLCKTDEIGELCVCAIATETMSYTIIASRIQYGTLWETCVKLLLPEVNPIILSMIKSQECLRMAIDSIHQVGVYCLALVPANTLPKTPLGGIHLSETKQLFLEGSLHPCNVLMCPHTCVTNLPKPRQKQPEIGPASVMVGNLVSGKRIAQASGRDLGQIEDNDQARKFLFLSEVLQWRAQTTPDHVLYTLLNCRGTIANSLTCVQLHKRAEKIAVMLMERGHLQDGDHVALVYPPDDLPKKRPAQIYKPSNPETLAYLDFSVSTTGMLAGVKMSHAATSAFCRSIKLQCELYPSREVAICLDPYCGLGFVLWCLCSVYSGHQSILIPPSELETNPALWLLAVSQYKVRDTFCSYSVMELCTKGLGSQTESLKARGLDLSRVRTCVVVAEERPRIALTQSFSKLFKDLGLHPRAVSTSLGCRVNLAICLQGTSGPDPTTVYVDMRALRHDRVRLVERGSPHSLPLMESGKILPGVRIIIANPETKGPLGDSHLGEIWVHSTHNASGYFTIYGDESLQSDHFNSRLSFGDTQTIWARTGYLGFLRRTELTDANGERHDALYVVGALDEAMELRGMRYHPIDIETSVIRAHKSITECAVFTWTNLLVVVVELDGSEQEALDLVPLVTNVVLEEHYLIVGVVVVVDIGVIPINSRGEKQRMHLRDGFLADQLDPIYVAYNM